MRLAWRAVLALATVQLVTPLCAKPIPGGAEFQQGRETVSVVALTPSILRVRYRGGPSASLDDPSWAVLSAVRAQRATVDHLADGFSTSAVTVTIDPQTLAVRVRRADGTDVVSDDGSGVTRSGDGFTLSKTMPHGTTILGLGDKTGGLDRAGKTFVNWNTDSYGFGAATDPIYKSIPFYIGVTGETAYGLLLDNSFRSTFDFAHAHDGRIEIRADGGTADYYILSGPSLRDVTRAYATLTGTAPMPPRWALGYQQSRYSYMSSAEVRALVDRFNRERFPLDAVWLDIDFQDRNRPFTINRQAFPDFERLVSDLAASKIATVPIVDLHIADAPKQGYAPYDSGLAGDHFLTNPDGSTYTAPVWPGPAVFPDFTRTDTRKWWGRLFKPLMDAGVAGIWNDMNEPAIFETPTKTMPLDTVHRIAGDGRTGRSASHAEIHNIYGMENSRATYEGLLELRPNQRPFVMTRATFAGGQRYAVTWTGDNSSTWDHLKLSVAQTINLGLSGFAWTGVDVGGFIGGASPDLMTKWFEYAAFMPIFRAHSAKGAPRAEPWVDGPEHLAIRKRYVEERYRLLPYFYAQAFNTSLTGDPIVRPIAYDYPGAELSCDPSMSFTVGDKLLVSGNPTPESLQPYAPCLPDGGWYDYWNGKPVDRTAAVMVKPSIDQLPVYVRAGSIIPTQTPTLRSEDGQKGVLQLQVYPGPACGGELYDDDGHSVNGEIRWQRLHCETLNNGTVRVTFDKPVGRFRPRWSAVRLVVHGGERPRTIETALPERRKIVDIAL